MPTTPINYDPACTTTTTTTMAPKKTILHYLACAPAISLRRRRRRRGHGEFRSVRAVFWPLVSMRFSSSDSAPDAAAAASQDGAAPAECQAPLPSPVTPAYVDMARIRWPEAAEGGGEGDEEEACRRFERCVVEMLVEEGKVADLTDVEELTRCWSSLSSPVFVDMVCRFYGELCKDLFSPTAGGNGVAELGEGDDDADIVVVVDK